MVKKAHETKKELTLACWRILFCWLLSLPPFSLFAGTCSHAHVLIIPSPFSPCPFALPLLVLSIHIAPLRGGGGQPWGGSGLSSSPSYLNPQGVPLPPPPLLPHSPSPTSTHSSAHPPPTPPPSPLLHTHTTSTLSALITEFRSLWCKCVCGQFHCRLGRAVV